MGAIFFKSLVALSGGALSVVLLRSASLSAASNSSFRTYLIAIHGGLALALFLCVYVIANQPITSDVPGYYVPAAHAVAAGLLPYRDFATNYAPLFSYVGAALLSLWSDPRSFALFSILLSALTLARWNDLAAQYFKQRIARAAPVLYATNGHVLTQCLLGTNQIWIGFALALSARLALRGDVFFSGVLQGVAVSVTKVLALLFWPAFWIAGRPRVLWPAGSTIMASIVYGAFALRGADVFLSAMG